MENYRKLTDLAQAEIEALRAEGVSLSDSDIISINSLCWEIQSPSKRVSLARGTPIKCGSIWLWPLTIHSSFWFSRIGSELDCAELALAYAMTHRDADLMTVTEVEIIAWGETLRCTQDELRAAMSHIIENERKEQLLSKAENCLEWPELVPDLVSRHGGTFEMWERHCSVAYVREFLSRQAAQDEADQNKNNRDRETLLLAKFTDSLRRKKHNG